MSQFNNPFSIDRAEQLGDKLFEFYAYHKNFEGLLKSKSLIVEGGRGSGKTMFFLYHAYFNKKKEALSNNKTYTDFFEQEKLLGVYFRADSNFVPAFQHKGLDEDEWIQLFGHFINISISKRLVEIAIDINDNYNDEKNVLKHPQNLSLFFDTPILNLTDLLSKLNSEEIKLISYINNLKIVERPKIFGNGYLLNYIAENLLKQDLLKDKSIHVFIDEYENMLPYQQRIINTLIKHPNPVIFDVGMRNEGLKTSETLATSEIISFPHDFSHFNFEDFNEQEYEELLIEICSKRLSKIGELKGKEDKYFDIRYYLGKYQSSYELMFIQQKHIDALKSKLKARLNAIANTEILHEIDDPILLRLNQVLLERGNVSAEQLAKDFSLFLSKKKSKYKDLLHNNKMGVVYLLCKENSKEKLYYGFKSYKSISSGIIRFFIELCEAAFQNAYRKGFTFAEPRSITAEEQTEAANFVSQYKVNDIETYTPYSNYLKRFVILLGNVFEKLHRDKKLSEPERNHFSTEYDKLSEESKKFLKSAELYSVLQKREETKDKNSSSIDSNNVEYHLNHIYAPYFKISPRKIRSLKIDSKILEIIINSDSQKANEAANSLVKNKEDNNGQLKIDLF